jgi:heterodisulfide reductase subunit B
MRFGYYPGCSLKGSAREYDESLRAIAGPLGVELVEIPDWNCCGATAAHNLDHHVALALPARVLALAESAGLYDLVVPCSACYNRLVSARHELLSNEKTRDEILEMIEMPFEGRVKIMNALEMLQKVFAGPPRTFPAPFAHKVACYYGCYLVRPAKVVNFDRPEDPQSMDEIMKQIGAKPIDWPHKVECCGAGLSISRTDLVAKLSGTIIEAAAKRGAEALIVVCPMCHTNLDMRRDWVEKVTGKTYPIPVLYVTQAIGLALGLDERTLGLHRHFVPVEFPPAEPAAAVVGAGAKAAAGAKGP